MDVIYWGGVSSGDSCGLYTRNSSGGELIEIWDQASVGGILVPCPPPAQVLAHELGHLLGLQNSTCSGYIMSPAIGSSVQPGECTAVDTVWETGWESPDPCDWPVPPQGCDPQSTPSSPMLFDLDRNGFRLTDADGGVWFDVDADGTADRVAWTRAGTLDAFLWLDRNLNDRVDHGRELFGDATRLAQGELAENGYIALAELDEPALGGNANGVIDPGDAVFSRLLLWIDWDHDGSSDPGESLTLEDVGIETIDLRYRTLGRHDRNGNLFRFESQAWVGASPRVRVKTVDVFFVLGSQQPAP